MNGESTPLQQGDKRSRILDSKYPTIVDLLAILGIFLIAQVISVYLAQWIGYGANSAQEGGMDEIARYALRIEEGRFALVSYSITMTITILATIILGFFRGCRSRIARFSYVGFNPSVLLWSMLMLICVAIVFDPLMNLLPSPPQLQGRGWAMVVTLVVVAPICEEILCRGIILEALRDKWGVWAACSLSSLMFAILHFHPTASVNALVIGVVLAYIYIRTSSIFAPIVLHAFNNALAYMLVWAGYESVTLRDIIPNTQIYMVVYIAAAVVLTISMIKIIRQLSRMRKEGEQKK